ncbi:pirin family protein [Microbacterium sp. SYP-A9085]|uniref:pirin family protein n=1 Tax=Microbacterium sp. SYP-A9085 TaxID=2664454 RepID=UPI00129A5410|nr:pirin family protein [Microbacterium sp. SYP-A9085]MRH28462.1 pirin family protein [Microbacterium sp. SYP-A9085]
MSNTEVDPQEVVCRDGGLPGPRSERAEGAPVEIIEAREVPLGGPRAMTVRRTLPQRQRSMIGAWCFADHYGPDDVSATGGMDVAPHPHTGLQTVSWLFEGAIDHIDSGGNTGRVLPGQLNLMTAGHGICHSEVSTAETTMLHGVQLWLALPDAVRDALPRRFQHYEPAPVAFDGGSALVFLGDLLGAVSPVDVHSPLVAAEIRLDAAATFELAVDPGYEHGVLVDAGDVTLEGVPVPRAAIGYTGIGSDRLRIRNEGTTPARIVLIGGAPFGEDIVMWWNFVGRDSDEIARYRREWQDEGERFGRVDGYVGHDPHGLTRLPAPALPGVRLRPRQNRPPHVQG